MMLRGAGTAVVLLLLVHPSAAVCAPPMTDPVMDSESHVFALLELAEYQLDDETNPFAWELLSWIGGDYNRLWIRSEGEVATTESEGDGDLEVLYGRLITPWWDFQIGGRGQLQFDGSDERGRGFAAIGIQGLAPGYFDVKVALYLSHEGDVSGRLELIFDEYVTQRLIAEPRLEMEAAAQEVEDFGVGTGINFVELGLRVRYELRRELAPYIGVNWQRQLMETADLARERGEDVSALSFVAGLRVWY